MLLISIMLVSSIFIMIILFEELYKRGGINREKSIAYQISEYDCGPTSMLNAIIYLFDRDEIPPEVIRNTMLYCLDCYSKEGIPGKRGTSRAAHDVSFQLAE